jgi:hypothetical protein
MSNARWRAVLPPLCSNGRPEAIPAQARAFLRERITELRAAAQSLDEGQLYRQWLARTSLLAARAEQDPGKTELRHDSRLRRSERARRKLRVVASRSSVSLTAGPVTIALPRECLAVARWSAARDAFRARDVNRVSKDLKWHTVRDVLQPLVANRILDVY